MLLDNAYLPTVYAVLAAGGLLLLQLIVADISAIRVGHKAGTPIPPDFSRFYFRAARAHANTNESIAAFIAFALAGILLAAPAPWLNALAWAYIACRAAHMLAYYLNRKLARSAVFGLSLLVLTTQLLLGLIA